MKKPHFDKIRKRYSVQGPNIMGRFIRLIISHVRFITHNHFLFCIYLLFFLTLSFLLLLFSLCLYYDKDVKSSCVPKRESMKKNNFMLSMLCNIWKTSCRNSPECHLIILILNLHKT